MAGWKYIDTTRPELYDIRADPGETNNLVDADPNRAVAMRVRLDEMLAVDSPRKESGRAVWDEQAARQMRSLGYVGGAVRDQELSVDPMQADPKDLIALHNPMCQVQGLIKHKQYTQAREICIKIVSQHPEVAEAHFLLAKIAMGERKYAEAAEHFSQYVAINPDDPMAHNRLGLAFWETGQQDRAIASVRRALKINPTFPEAYGNLGRFLLLQGDVDQGIHNLQKAVELKPDFGVAHLALARALWKQKKADDAAYHLQQVIQTGPDRAEAYFALAGIRRAQRRLDDAADHYRQAIAKRPKFLAAHQHLGNVLQSQRKLTEALEHYRRALELAPNSIDLLNNVAWILATHPDPHLRQTEEALRIARRAADEKGGADPSVLDTLAAAYANANQFDEAVATATEALKLLDATNHKAFQKQLRQRLQLYQQGQPHREPIAEQEHRR